MSESGNRPPGGRFPDFAKRRRLFPAKTHKPRTAVSPEIVHQVDGFRTLPMVQIRWDPRIIGPFRHTQIKIHRELMADDDEIDAWTKNVALAVSFVSVCVSVAAIIGVISSSIASGAEAGV